MQNEFQLAAPQKGSEGGVGGWLDGVGSELLVNFRTVGRMEALVRHIGVELTWMYSQRVRKFTNSFESTAITHSFKRTF